MKPLSILIADDHEMIRHGLRSVLEKQPGWKVCAEAATGRQAVEKARQTRPDVIVMDYMMPELNGLEATRQILQELETAEILILTMHESESIVRDVLAAGARGYMLKSDAGKALVGAVQALSLHKPYFTPKISEMLASGYLKPEHLQKPGDATGTGLTPREREIVQLLAEGKSNKEVADALAISVKTAETHRTNVMRKLQIHSVSELVRYAIRNNITAA